MGGWKLEVGKMFLYMAFPVGLFHYFNQPEYFEEYVLSMKRNSYHPPGKQSDREALEQCIIDMRKKKDRQLLEALESNNKQ